MILTFEERLARAVKMMDNGTFRGLSRAASPFAPQDASYNGMHQSLTDVGPLPFLVVANDGSFANFTSIMDAIDSVPAGGQAFIWIKYTGTDYSDAGPVALGTKDITLFGAGHGDALTNLTPMVRWDVSGASFITSSSGANLKTDNMRIEPVGTTWGGATGLQLTIHNTYIGNNISSPVTLTARHSNVNLLAGVDFLDIVDSRVDFGAGSYSLSGSRLIGCAVACPGTATLDNPGTSTGEYGVFNDNSFNGGTYVFTGWTQIEFVGNTTQAEVVFGPTLSGAITVSFESCRNIHYASNLWGSTVTFSATGANNRGNISGTAFSMVIAGDGFSFNVTLEGDRGLGSTPALGLTISGDFNVGTVFANNYTLGVDVTGADNLVNVTGNNNTTDVQSNGASNKLVTGVNTVINPAAPAGTDVYL